MRRIVEVINAGSVFHGQAGKNDIVHGSANAMS